MEGISTLLSILTVPPQFEIPQSTTQFLMLLHWFIDLRSNFNFTATELAWVWALGRGYKNKVLNWREGIEKAWHMANENWHQMWWEMKWDGDNVLCRTSRSWSQHWCWKCNTVETDHAGSKGCLKTEGILPLPKICMQPEDDVHLWLSHLWLSSTPALRFQRYNNLTIENQDVTPIYWPKIHHLDIYSISSPLILTSILVRPRRRKDLNEVLQTETVFTNVSKASMIRCDLLSLVSLGDHNTKFMCHRRS